MQGVQGVQPGAVRDEAKEQLILPGRRPGSRRRHGLVGKGAARVLAATGGLVVQRRVWDRFPAPDQA